MSDFQREERYIVVKRKDIDEEQERDLGWWLEHVGIPTRECVVVEPDWPIYEQVWGMVKALAEGAEPSNEVAKDAVVAAYQEGAKNAEQRMRGEIEKLTTFAREVLRRSAFDGCDLSGGDAQDLAERYGLIREVEVSEPCDNEHCVCAEVCQPPWTCYRFTEMLQEAS